jgi:predicted dinucleotide-binding enzyme
MENLIVITQFPWTSLGSAMIDLNSLHIEPSVLHLITKSVALELTVLPIAQNNDVVILAVPPMFHNQVLIDVRVLLGGNKKIKPISVPRDSIVQAIHRFYETTDS